MLRIHGADVTVQQEAAPASAAGDGGELGPAVEVESGREGVIALLDGIGLEEVDLRSDGPKTRG
jgi:hypothetical protein